MPVFPPSVTPAQLNKLSAHTLVDHLGIEITDVSESSISARMPVDHRTRQPMGLLHGGASVVLAETLGSLAAHCLLDLRTQHAVGLEINANHLRSVRSGFVTGTATPLHIGKRTHVWEIRITNEQNQLVCVSRITMAILERMKEDA